MTCYGPLTAYRPRKNSGDGRLVFDKRKSETGIKILIPCGQCVGCRLDYSKQWAVRFMHEKQMHMLSSFITLTYSPENVPEGGSLRMDDYVKFLKRLRKRFGDGIRFGGCGEYGDATGRPHYHILLLNCDFPDRRFYKNSDTGYPLYTSKELDKLWTVRGVNLGFANIGDVDYDSCAYVARYVMKKIVGKDTYDSSLYCPTTGIVREPCFFTMSRRPGIGSSWYDRFGPHAYQWDSVVFKGSECRPPRYYDNRRIGPAINDKIKIKRRRMAALGRADQTLARLRVREVVALAKLQLKAKKL